MICGDPVHAKAHLAGFIRRDASWGLSLLLEEFLLENRFHFRLMLGGAGLAFAGCYLLWTDFIAPRLGVKTWED